MRIAIMVLCFNAWNQIIIKFLYDGSRFVATQTSLLMDSVGNLPNYKPSKLQSYK